MTSALEALQSMLDESLTRDKQSPATEARRELDPRLHPYQAQAINHLWSNPRAGLFMQMGLGKTAVVLQALTPEHFPVLVVAPKRVAEHVWPVEGPKWRPDLSIAVAAGTPAKRARAIESGAQITVIGRDNAKDIEPGRFRTIVIDELSGYKSRGSQRWKHMRKITDASPYVWGLTGTPAPNGLMDLWAQLFLLDKGSALGRTLTSYRNRFFLPGRRIANNIVVEWKPREEAQTRIEELIAPICISMKASDYLDNPEPLFNTVTVPLSTNTRKIYEKMSSTLVAQIGDQFHTAGNPAVLTGKLSQITAGFLYDDDGERRATALHSEKVMAVAEIVEGTGSPVLVGYRYVWERDALLAAIPGSRTIDDPGVLADWDEGLVPALLAHPASAGHGLNLQKGGHTVAWATMPWSLEEWEQFIGRLARQGQTQQVLVHMPVSPETVDEAIVARQIQKASVQDAIMMALKVNG